MDYQKLISELKDEIDNYSFKDSEYQKIYDRAYRNLETSFDAQSNALNQSYYNEKRKAAGESALNTKNAAEQLAARGLAHSGESADMIIGQNMALSNRLSDLAQSNTAARVELMRDYGKQRTELDKSLAQQMSEAIKAEKGLLHDRLEHLEGLYFDKQKLDFDRDTLEKQLVADKEKWQAQLDAEQKKQHNQLDAEKEKWQAQLDADNAKWKTQLEAEAANDAEERAAAEEKWRNQLAAEQYMQQLAINADREEWQAKLENDRYEFDKTLAADQSKWEAEFSAQNRDWVSNVISKLFGKSKNEEQQTGGEEELTDGLAPDVTIQTMANNIIGRFSDKTKRLSEYAQEQVYVDFARLIAVSGLDSKYAEQVLATLRSKGFKKDFSIELALQDYVKDGYEIYNQAFDAYYEGFCSDGTPEDEAFVKATELAEEEVKAHVNTQGLDKETKKQVLRMYGIN